MKEIWKDCTEDSNYRISSLGRVISKARWVNSGPNNGRRFIDEKILSPFLSKETGYMQIQLGNRKRAGIHRLIALAFIDGYKPGLVVNHKNGIRADNRIENLEWVSQSENHLHSYRELGRKGSHTGKFSDLHHVSRPVISTNIKTGESEYFACASDAVRKYGFDGGGISKVCHGFQKSHKGYTWKFAEAAMLQYPEARFA